MAVVAAVAIILIGSILGSLVQASPPGSPFENTVTAKDYVVDCYKNSTTTSSTQRTIYLIPGHEGKLYELPIQSIDLFVNHGMFDSLCDQKSNNNYETKIVTIDPSSLQQSLGSVSTSDKNELFAEKLYDDDQDTERTSSVETEPNDDLKTCEPEDSEATEVTEPENETNPDDTDNVPKSESKDETTIDNGFNELDTSVSQLTEHKNQEIPDNVDNAEPSTNEESETNVEKNSNDIDNTLTDSLDASELTTEKDTVDTYKNSVFEPNFNELINEMINDYMKNTGAFPTKVNEKQNGLNIDDLGNEFDLADSDLNETENPEISNDDVNDTDNNKTDIKSDETEENGQMISLEEDNSKFASESTDSSETTVNDLDLEANNGNMANKMDSLMQNIKDTIESIYAMMAKTKVADVPVTASTSSDETEDNSDPGFTELDSTSGPSSCDETEPNSDPGFTELDSTSGPSSWDKSEANSDPGFTELDSTSVPSSWDKTEANSDPGFTELDSTSGPSSLDETDAPVETSEPSFSVANTDDESYESALPTSSLQTISTDSHPVDSYVDLDGFENTLTDDSLSGKQEDKSQPISDVSEKYDEAISPETPATQNAASDSECDCKDPVFDLVAMFQDLCDKVSSMDETMPTCKKNKAMVNLVQNMLSEFGEGSPDLKNHEEFSSASDIATVTPAAVTPSSEVSVNHDSLVDTDETKTKLEADPSSTSLLTPPSDTPVTENVDVFRPGVVLPTSENENEFEPISLSQPKLESSTIYTGTPQDEDNRNLEPQSMNSDPYVSSPVEEPSTTTSPLLSTPPSNTQTVEKDDTSEPAIELSVADLPNECEPVPESEPSTINTVIPESEDSKNLESQPKYSDLYGTMLSTVEEPSATNPLLTAPPSETSTVEKDDKSEAADKLSAADLTNDFEPFSVSEPNWGLSTISNVEPENEDYISSESQSMYSGLGGIMFAPDMSTANPLLPIPPSDTPKVEKGHISEFPGEFPTADLEKESEPVSEFESKEKSSTISDVPHQVKSFSFSEVPTKGFLKPSTVEWPKNPSVAPTFVNTLPLTKKGTIPGRTFESRIISSIPSVTEDDRLYNPRFESQSLPTDSILDENVLTSTSYDQTTPPSPGFNDVTKYDVEVEQNNWPQTYENLKNPCSAQSCSTTSAMCNDIYFSPPFSFYDNCFPPVCPPVPTCDIFNPTLPFGDPCYDPCYDPFRQPYTPFPPYDDCCIPPFPHFPVTLNGEFTPHVPHHNSFTPYVQTPPPVYSRGPLPLTVPQNLFPHLNEGFPLPIDNCFPPLPDGFPLPTNNLIPPDHKFDVFRQPPFESNQFIHPGSCLLPPPVIPETFENPFPYEMPYNPLPDSFAAPHSFNFPPTQMNEPFSPFPPVKPLIQNGQYPYC